MQAKFKDRGHRSYQEMKHLHREIISTNIDATNMQPGFPFMKCD